MGGRQSSQNSTPRQNANQSSTNPLRYSMDGSLEESAGARRIGGLFGPSSSSGLSSTPPDRGVPRRRRRRDRNDHLIEAHSLPANLFPAILSAEIKCPVCNKRIGSDEIESHLLACLAKPRVSYNEDTLKAHAGECIICFDEMCTGEQIARLPCLCIYHKKCLDDWFERNRCCPEHPDQIPQEYSEANSLNSASNIVNNDNISNTEQTSDVESSSPNVFVPPLELDEENEHQNSQNNESDLSQSNEHFHTPSLTFQNIPLINNEANQNSSLNLETMQSHSQNSPLSLPDEIIDATEDITANDNIERSPFTCSHSVHSPSGRTIVHVDDGSIHGSPSLFDDDEIAQLASKIKTILVAESPRNNEIDNT